MTHLRYEAWPAPGATPYTVQVRDLQAAAGTGTLTKKPIGNGSVEIPRGALRADGTEVLDAVVFTDAVTPANDVTSTIRVYRPGTDTPIHEWLTEDPVASTDATNTVRLSGRNIEAVLDYEHVEMYDWDGTAVFQSRFPDHIYGGRNLIVNPGLEDSPIVEEVYELWNDQIAASTFTLTMEGATTAAIAFDALPAAVEAAIELTAGITDCLVIGTGTEADPWRIEFVTPSTIDPDMTVTDAGGLTSTLTQIQDGGLSIAPFTVAQTIAQGVNWVHGVHASDSPNIDDAQANTGTYSLRFNGLTAQFTGVQQVVNVKPGGIYQASMGARTSGGGEPYRMVIRTPTEEFIASTTFSGTVLVPNTWTQFTITDVTIPDGISQVVVRFSYIGTGNPDPVFTDDWVFAEGLAAATPGSQLIDLFNDAQTDHAPTRAALTFINLDFDAVNDSNTVAWTDSALSITIKRRQSYFQMMRQYEKLGYEWRLVPTVGTPGEWDLQVFNSGGMGTDNGGADDPAIVVGQGTLPSNVTRQKPAANYLMAEGASGSTTRLADAGSIAAVGRRTQGIFDRRFTDTDPLTAWVTARLANFLAETLAPRIVIAEPNTADDWPRPLDEYVPADIVDFILADGATRVERRIEAVSYNDTQDGLVWTVEGGTATPYVTSSGGAGPVAFAPGDDKGFVTGPVGGVSSQINVLGAAVTAILEEFRFDEDPELQPVPANTGGVGSRPAFTIRVAASDARAESKAAADLQCFGVDDSAQITQAIDIVVALGFGRVVASEGTFIYPSGSVLTIPATVLAAGLGEGVTEFQSANAATATATITGELRDVNLSDAGGVL